MTAIKGHYDGKGIVFDEPVPAEIPIDAPVTVVFENGEAKAALDEIAALARSGGLPPDFSQQHEHYVKGTPRK